MKGKKIQIVVVMLVILTIGFTGCTEQNNDNSNRNGGETTGNEHIMDTFQLHRDLDVQTDYATYMTMDYKSMEEGDTLIFRDFIYTIQYLNDVDATEITFRISVSETEWKSTQFYFKGDITSSFNIGDFVSITVTIKHVILSDVQGMDLDIEIYEQAWKSEEYFRDNMATSSIGGFFPMSVDTIEKI